MKHIFTIILSLVLFSNINTHAQCVANAGPDKTICPSPGSVQIGGIAQPQTTYSWTPVIGLNNPNISSPKAAPTATTTYTLTTSTNLITNGNFEQGYTGFSSAYTAVTRNYQGGAGTYTIGVNPSNYLSNWCNATNHTVNGTQMMIVDGSSRRQFPPANDIFWGQTVTVEPNRTYNFSVWFLATAIEDTNSLMPLIQLTVNGIIVADSFRLPYNRSCPWVNLIVPVNAGNATSVSLGMRTLTNWFNLLGNDFAVDDIEMLCTSTDDVTVTVCPPCPVITPSGPIDYYTPVDGAPNGRLLSSNITTGNQWYFNNVAIPNANAQTYNIKNQWGYTPGGDYYAMNNGCKSNIVHVDFKHYGYGRYGEENLNRLGAKIHPIQTSNYYCFNSTNNLIRQFDLGPSAYYVWNFPVTPIGGVPNITLTPGSYNPNSNQAQVNIGGSLGTIMPYVQGIANLNGREIIIDYYHILSHSIYISTNQQVCANAGQTITNFAISSLKTIPGGSGFDWEEYDFGPTGTIFSGPGAGQRSVIIPGRSTPQALTVKFTGNSFVQKRFYYNWGGCYEEKYNVTLYNGCFAGQVSGSLDVNIFPNPATNQLTITSTQSISYIEISNLMTPTLKKIKVNGTKSTTIDVLDLSPGVYNCKITTNKGVENQKLIIKR
jgi:Secretion system C-terminal sorting domain